MMIYGVYDVTANRLVNVFLAKNDITAIRMNTVCGDDNASPLRRGFNLVRVTSCDDEIKYENICRLVDCEPTLNEYLEKEGL